MNFCMKLGRFARSKAFKSLRTPFEEIRHLRISITLDYARRSIQFRHFRKVTG